MNTRGPTGAETSLGFDIEGVEDREPLTLVAEALRLPGLDGDLERCLVEAAKIAQPVFTGIEVEQISVSAEDKQVFVQVKNINESETDSLKRFARFIAAYGHLETIVFSEEDRVESAIPSPIPVRIGGAYPERIIDEAVIEAAAYDLLPEKFHTLPSHEEQKRSLQSVVRNYPFRSVQIDNQEGIWEIRSAYSTRVLSTSWFEKFSNDLADLRSDDKIGPVRFVLDRQDADLFSRVCKALGHEFQWRASYNHETNEVHVSARQSELNRVAAEKPGLCERFLAKTGYRLVLDGYSDDRPTARETFFLSPNSQEGLSQSKLAREVKSLSRTMPSFMLPGLPVIRHGSNTITVPYAVEGLSENLIYNAIAGVEDRTFPINLEHWPVQEPPTQSKMLSAFSSLISQFPFVDSSVSVASGSITIRYHNEFPVEHRSWYREAKEAARKLADHCKVEAQFIREIQYEQLYNIVADELKTQMRWRIGDFDAKTQRCVLEIERKQNDLGSEELKSRLEYRTGWTVDIHEQTEQSSDAAMITFAQGDSLQGLTYIEARAAEEGVMSILPPGLGDCAVKLEGNRVVVASEAKNLPTPYLLSISNELSRLVVPVELQLNKGTVLPPNQEMMQDIIGRALPDGDYLKTLEDFGNKWVATVYRREEIAPISDLLEQSLTDCAGKTVELHYQAVSEGFSTLLQEVPEDAARFLVEVCDQQGVTTNTSRFAEKYKEHFMLLSPSVVCLQKNFGEGRVDLTGMTTRAIDKKGTGVVEDAISWRVLKNENLELAIHIVDPTWMFEFGSQTDNDALERVISDQGRGHRIPLIRDDEVVYKSSLKRGQDKAAITLFLEISPEGEEVGYRFERSKIRLDHRSSFEEVDSYLESHNSAAASGRYRTLHRFMRPLLHRIRDEGVNLGHSSESRARQIVASSTYLFDKYAAGFLQARGVPFAELVQPAPDREKQLEVIERARQYGFKSDEEPSQDLALRALAHLGKKMPRLRYKRIMATLTEPAKFQLGRGEKHYTMNASITRATRPLKSYASLLTIRALERSLRGAEPIASLHVGRAVDHINKSQSHPRTRSGVFRDIQRFQNFIDKEGGRNFGVLSKGDPSAPELHVAKLGKAIGRVLIPGVNEGDSVLCVATGFDFVKSEALVELL